MPESKPPSPRPMPAVGNPGRDRPLDVFMPPSGVGGMCTDRPMPVNPGRAPGGGEGDK